MSKPYPGPWIIRNLLFTAGHIDRFILKAFDSNADCVVLDLEDAVPASKKDFARSNILAHAARHKAPWQALMVRTNSRETGMMMKDLDGVACKEIDGFVFPKAYRADDIRWWDAQLARKESALGLPAGYFVTIALMETPEAIMKACEIAEASERVIGLLFGHADFLTYMEGGHGIDGRGIHCPRHLVSMAARAAGIAAIDTFHPDVHDDEGLRLHISQAKELGFEGMLVMSPRQIETTREMYTPSDAQVAEARELVRLAADAIGEDRSIIITDGKFISPPSLKRARKLLQRYENISAFEDQRGALPRQNPTA